MVFGLSFDKVAPTAMPAPTANETTLPIPPLELGMMTFSRERHGALRVGIVVRIIGEMFTDQMLANAVTIVQQRHPLLRATMNADDEFVVKQTLPVRCGRHVRAHDVSWQDVWDSMGAYQIGSPLWGLTLVAPGSQGSNCTFELMLTAEHAVGDGRSLSHLMHELLCHLTEQAPPSTTPTPVPPFIEQAMASWTQNLPWSTYLKLACGLGLANPVLAFLRWKSTPLRPPDNVDFTESSARWSTVTLAQSETESLVQLARANGVTLTTLLMALVMEQLPSSATWPASCLCPVDLRGRYPTGRIPADRVSFHVQTTRIRVERSEDPWQVARQCREAIQCQLSDGTVFAMARLASMGVTVVGARMRPDRNQAPMGFLSNLGVVPIQPRYGSRVVQEVVPVLHTPPINLRQCMAVTAAGRLTLAFRTPDVDQDDADPNRFASAVRDRIQHLLAEAKAS
ncbi:unnamed protein product (mitochondrion) [Plasmodiophora brassicae]|uniref:Phthiocerol/phthiodiolone dimycocerosyl transferase C-terminal domain-containing protein n=1 Tax=Plasmodiophora brassicae TaxID=37360 RepID=A0A0G4IMC2_PLABS|nr:hypothetical protein PBRA_004994 [Plasmodiophora brassicae]SPQ99262.1 unnamed protein product [Plasmodiophora brassicae]